jgi:hypothetical protein
MGYQHFFLWTIVCGLPALLLLLWVPMPRAAQPGRRMRRRLGTALLLALPLAVAAAERVLRRLRPARPGGAARRGWVLREGTATRA